MKRFEDWGKRIGHLCRLVQAIWIRNSGATLMVLIFYACVDLLGIGSVIATRILIQEATEGTSPIRLDGRVVLCLLLIVGAFVSTRIKGIANIPLFDKLQRDVGAKVMREIYMITGRFPHISFLEPETAARINRMMLYAQDSMLTQNLVHLFSAVTCALSLIMLSLIYWEWALYVILVLLLHTAGYAIESSEGIKRWKMRCKQESEVRYEQKLKDTYLDRAMMRELHVFGGGSYIENTWSSLRRKLNDELWALEATLLKRRFLSRSLQGAVNVLTLLWGSFACTKRWLTQEAFAWLFVLNNQVAAVCAMLFSEWRMAWGSASEVGEVLDFIAHPPEEPRAMLDTVKQDMGETGLDSGDMAHLSKLYFNYPNGTQALEAVNLRVRLGEKLLIVGLNGAGKTTLAKVLLGMLPPTSGTALFMGRCASDVEVHRQVGAAWQDYMEYPFKIREVVGFGCVQQMKQDEAIREAMSKAQLGIFLDEDLDRSMTKLFDDDGLECSGGQWSRFALARAYMGDKSVLVLDEPSAKLDPLAECELFKQITEQNTEKTVIMISHRIGFARYADRIMVMDGSHVVQVGRYQELLQTPGCFQELYQTQRKWYLPADAKDDKEMRA